MSMGALLWGTAGETHAVVGEHIRFAVVLAAAGIALATMTSFNQLGCHPTPPPGAPATTARKTVTEHS